MTQPTAINEPVNSEAVTESDRSPDHSPTIQPVHAFCGACNRGEIHDDQSVVPRSMIRQAYDLAKALHS